ncbi:hypothetical protein FH608_046520 [Nonomuraea phyllanthi]|uniref:Uncharacterized protein n=1 Tax=Nonomuraea phyllanthi TaxID=2219224 RepID=A0A5C4V8X0_9ACTN|nr:hypothetical protein [Nonomuraea phyllanthi]KAB8186948.1 hypothetical protein FH608_046520 [Nonomuraea phyllanthi]
MTHVDDLHEPNDREPGEPEQEPPLDLDDLEKLYDLSGEPGALPAWAHVVYLNVPVLIAELREARRRIAEWEALPGREEFATTDQRDIPPNKHHPYRVTPGEALKAPEKGRQAWVRRLTVHPWEPIDGAPF